MTLDDNDKDILNEFLEIIKRSPFNDLVEMDDLWSLTSPESKHLINNIVSIDPMKYGFNGKQVLQEPVPKNAVKIENQLDLQSGEYELTSGTYLPKPVFEAFNKMADSFLKDYPDRKLMVGSGYRSPAFQIVTLIYILAKVYDFDISKTLKRVAMPKYSQHCSVSNTAIDMLNIDGEPSDEEPEKFKDSVEYKWLLENAKKFNFYESYPPHNSDGIMWEPWHWQYLN